MIFSELDYLKGYIQSHTFVCVNKALGVEYYKGELEEGSEWYPSFPALFINCPQITPSSEGLSGYSKLQFVLSLYTAINISDKQQQAFLEELLGLLKEIPAPDGGSGLFRFGSAQLHGYFKQTLAYKIDIIVE